jgi:hypothetical protein
MEPVLRLARTVFGAVRREDIAALDAHQALEAAFGGARPSTTRRGISPCSVAG